METYSYPMTNTANGRVTPETLKAQVLAAGLTTCTEINALDCQRYGLGCYTGGTISAVFSAPLTGAEQTTLDATVAAHVGVSIAATRFWASVEIADKKKDIIEVTTWDEIGGVITSPDYFVPKLATLFARVVGQYKTVGVGAEIRLKETVPAGTTRIISLVLALPDTAGAWVHIPSFNTNAPPSPGQNLYQLEGRLNAATSASLRYTSLSLMELET